MQYVVHAYDHTDAGAYDRRMAVRPAHFELVRDLKAKGQFIIGGALLDPDGKMIGSMLVVDFDTDEALQEWLQREPYLTGNVWDKVDIKPFRKADV
ncbi:hypothetical protein DYU11_29405 [Fibrisoma montanum]|uniref:YCII-related domain-containing protein n=1 Tax=Fibrisoma montanum TaxID=2305895 RepID=A0A418LXT3_9BACT|nr:YciI family protein [Fibrisoma montanum]RIV18076.1 hypothetical protein DYU11_29405 [Fibrisoma montanum]